MAIECYRLEIGALHFGAWVENVLHFNCDNDDDSTSRTLASELVAAFQSEVMDLWLGCLPESYAIQWLKAKRVRNSGGDSWWQEFPGGGTNGTLGTGAATLNTSPIIKLYPGMGSDTQGRIFMPGIAESMLDGNVYNATYVTATVDLMAVMLAFDNGGKDWVLAINSPKLNASVQVVAAALGPIIGNIGRRRTPR